MRASASPRATTAAMHGDGPSAIGEPGDAASVSTHHASVDMTDNMRFTPVGHHRAGAAKRSASSSVNAGKLRHEMVLGSEADLQAHYADMLKMPGMEHADPNAVTLEAGQSGEMLWRFTRGGRVAFGRLLPGHYDAGMRGQVSVR
ncbi:cupredoxin domain-containing protein [Cupriavidus basilensis]